MKTIFVLLLAISAIGCGYSKNNGTPAGGAPVIAALMPTMATHGGAGFNLTVNGSGFVSGSVVHFGSAQHAPIMVMGNQLVVAISASEIANAASVTVFVQNPGGTGMYMNQPGPMSNSVTFTVE